MQAVCDKCLSHGLLMQHILHHCSIARVGFSTGVKSWIEQRSVWNGYSCINIWEMLFFFFISPSLSGNWGGGILDEKSPWLCSSLASHACLLFWRPPVSGLMEMFLQSRVVAALCELSVETALEIRASIVRGPVVEKKRRKKLKWKINHKGLTSVNCRGH